VSANLAPMTEHQASRTLLKSPPELWAECSDPQSLAKHLGEPAGEIRITKLEPEHTVAWEGDRASGTVTLEPSGWGTRVTVTARTNGAVTARTSDPEPEPAAAGATDAPRPHEEEPDSAHGGFLARLRRLLAPPTPVAEEPPKATPTPADPVAPPTPAPPEQPAPAAESPPPEPPAEGAVSPTAALDSLGKAHHRPFSRA
jgi:hypothetical protein